MATPEAFTPKSTEASIRVPALLNLFPGLENLIQGNIPGLKNLAGLRLRPDDRWDKYRKTDDFDLLAPGDKFVAHFRFLNFRQQAFGSRIRHDVILDIGWRDNKGRPLLVTYASPKPENPLLYLSHIWVGPLGWEKIIIELDQEIRGNPKLNIEEIFLNQPAYCTKIRVGIRPSGEPSVDVPIALRKSVKTTYDQKKGLLTVEGQEPFFSKPFSLLTLPVELECNAPYLTP